MTCNDQPASGLEQRGRSRAKKAPKYSCPTASSISMETMRSYVPRHVAVVHQPQLDAVRQPRGLHALPRELELRLRDGDARDPAAGRARRLDREPAPAAADLQHVVLRPDAGQFQRPAGSWHPARRPASGPAARTRRRSTVMVSGPAQAVEVVAQVVVRADVAAAPRGVLRRRAWQHAVGERPARPRVQRRGVERRHVLRPAARSAPVRSSAVPLAGHERLAEPDIAVQYEAREEAVIADPQRGARRRRAVRRTSTPRRREAGRSSRPVFSPESSRRTARMHAALGRVGGGTRDGHRDARGWACGGWAVCAGSSSRAACQADPRHVERHDAGWRAAGRGAQRSGVERHAPSPHSSAVKTLPPSRHEVDRIVACVGPDPTKLNS